jgi:hypothetical protein
MTEEEWLACDDPMALAVVVWEPGRQRGRKQRLFACACVRQVWHHLVDERSRRALEAAEAEALSEDEALALMSDAKAAIEGTVGVRLDSAENAAATAVFFAPGGLTATARAARISATWGRREEDILERRVQAALLRDVFGNPFRPAALAPACRTAVAVTLARSAYAERQLPSGHLDNARLAVLSDALEEAGCTDANVLAHLRSPGPHVRGCWALDLVLGKE